MVVVNGPMVARWASHSLVSPSRSMCIYGGHVFKLHHLWTLSRFSSDVAERVTFARIAQRARVVFTVRLRKISVLAKSVKIQPNALIVTEITEPSIGVARYIEKRSRLTVSWHVTIYLTYLREDATRIAVARFVFGEANGFSIFTV